MTYCTEAETVERIAELERQRDDLLEANNRYLERARAAELQRDAALAELIVTEKALKASAVFSDMRAALDLIRKYQTP